MSYTYSCRFFLVKKENDDGWKLTEFTNKFVEMKLLPIDIGSKTSAHHALFVSSLIMNGNLSIRQAVSVMELLGVPCSKTGLQNIKEIVDSNVFAPSAQSIQMFAREVIDFMYLDETPYKYLSEIIKGGRRKKHNSYIQQICSGLNSNFQFALFSVLDSRTKECMAKVIDLPAFENLKDFESDGLKQYQLFADLINVVYQRCGAHGFRYAKAPFIDLLQSIEQASYDLATKKITQEQFDDLIKKKQIGLDEYDLHLFETTYALQSIFYIEENAKAEAERIIAEQNAEGDKTKQIYIHTNEKYRQTYTIPLKQCIERSFQKLKLVAEENEMLSSTQLKPLTYIDNAFNSLFAFIDNPELEPHNNYCEANFKDLLRVRRNNNDMASSKEEVRRIAHTIEPLSKPWLSIVCVLLKSNYPFSIV